jgi:S-adenosylmethionine:tRNA ribosyltransferase-isomerase
VKTSSFSFDLPQDSIAQHPTSERGGSRLMVLDRTSGRITHGRIDRLPQYVERGTVMVVNKSRVIKARLYGTASQTGGRVEFVLLVELGPGLWRTLAGKARKQVSGKKFEFPENVTAEVVDESKLPESAFPEDGRDHRGRAAGQAFRYLRFSPPIDLGYLDRHGHVPLPPYISREDTRFDAERYQTVYAEEPGSAAAPTAGLHLTEELLDVLQRSGIILSKITLHVGAGTFLPIRTEEVEQHTMHEERYDIPARSAGQINTALQEGRSILAVGTTVVRALESAYDDDIRGVAAGTRLTSLFIYPGYRFKVVSQLLTNFHTPRSSLLVLVAAFAGWKRILDTYNLAVREGYRFFSYGDAMLIR